MWTSEQCKRAGAARLILAAALLSWSCRGVAADPPSGTWLAKEAEASRVQLERQLRGFDVAMLETGHRYIDLYWAGRDANWGAAAYQVGKIRLAIENGLERRPGRAASARPFLAGPLAAMDAAVAARDPALFAARFEELTAACNECHSLEQVPFFEIRPPETRVSPIRHGVAPAADWSGE
jgi:hypothetical protein